MGGFLDKDDSRVIKSPKKTSLNKVQTDNTFNEPEESNKQPFNIETDNISKTTEPVSAHFGVIDHYDNQIPVQQREHLLSLDQPEDRPKHQSFTVGGDDYETAKSGSNIENSLLDVKKNKSGRSIN